MMRKQKNTYSKFLMVAFAFAALVIALGPFVQGRIPYFFNPLLRIARILFALFIGLALPALSSAFLFKRKFGFRPFQAFAFGLIISVACVTSTTYWAARYFGFETVTILISLLAVSIIIWLAACLGKESSSLEPPLVTHSRHIILLVLIGFIFVLAVWYPFFDMGKVSSVDDDARAELYRTWYPFLLLGNPKETAVTIPAIGDWSFIICSDVAAVSSTGVPPKNPFFCSEPLRYYYFYHLYTAVFIKLSGGYLNVQSAGVATIIITAISVYLGLFAIIRRWLNSFGGALFSLLLITLIGGFDIIPSIIYRIKFYHWPCNVDHWAQFIHWKIFSCLTHFHWFPQHLWGILFYMLFFYLYGKYGLKGMSFALCVVCLAASMGFSAIAAIGGCAALLVFLIIDAFILIRRKVPIQKWSSFARNVSSLIVVGIIALALVFPMYWAATHDSFDNGSLIRRFRLPPLHTPLFMPQDYRPGNPFVYLGGLVLLELAELGPVLIFGIAGLFCLGAWKGGVAKRIVLSILIGSFILVHTTEMGGKNPGDVSSKVIGIIYWWSLAILGGLFFKERRYLLNRFDLGLHLKNGCKKVTRVFAISISALVITLGVMTTLYGINCRGNKLMLPVDEYLSFLFIRNHLPTQATVQRGPTNPEILLPGWAWRLSPYLNRFAAQEYPVDQNLLNEFEIELELGFKTTDPALAHEIFIRRGVDYLLIGSYERELYKGGAMQKFEISSSYFRKIWSLRQLAIYEVIKQNPKAHVIALDQ